MAVDPTIALQLLEEGDIDIILDVRSDEEFLAGHHPQAVHLPLDQLKSMTVLPDYFETNARVLTTCASGARAKEAAEILHTKHGLENVIAVSPGSLV
jgi:rhodanese-related sulfurtransferase